MKRLISPDKKRRRLFWIEGGSQQGQSALSPIRGSAFGAHPQVKVLRRHKHPICIIETALADAVEPNREGRAKGSSSLIRWANKICNRRSSRFNHPVAHPAHAARVFNAIFVTEAKIARKIFSHSIGVEHDSIEQWRQGVGQRGLAGAGQAHDEDLPHSSYRLSSYFPYPRFVHTATNVSPIFRLTLQLR